MANLLAEGYRRLFKGKRFYICMIVYLSIALFEIIIYRIGNTMFSGAGDLLNVDTLIFSGLSLTVLMTAITGGMLIARDYTNNTIRNKIIIGHSRTNIYLANLIVTSTIILIYLFAYILFICAVGIPLVGTGEFPSADMVKNIFLTIPIMLAFSSLITFITMSIKSVGGAILAIALDYVGSFLGTVLQILAIKYEELARFLEECLPSMQISMIRSSITEVPDHAGLMVLYDVIIIAASTVGGILIFNKTDLK